MRSTHVAYSTSGIFSLLYSIPLYEFYTNTIFIYTHLFLHSHVDGHLDSFWFFVVMNDVMKMFCACLLVHICIHFCWVIPGEELLGQRLCICSALVDITSFSELFNNLHFHQQI